MVLMSQLSPGNWSKLIFRRETKEALTFVVHPQISATVLRNGKHSSARKSLYGNELLIFKVSDTMVCGDPDSSAIILEKRIRRIIQLPAFLAANGITLDLSVIPSVQTSTGAEPDTSIPVG